MAERLAKVLERLADEGKLESTLDVLENAAVAHSSTEDWPPSPKREKQAGYYLPEHVIICSLLLNVGFQNVSEFVQYYRKHKCMIETAKYKSRPQNLARVAVLK